MANGVVVPSSRRPFWFLRRQLMRVQLSCQLKDFLPLVRLFYQVCCSQNSRRMRHLQLVKQIFIKRRTRAMALT